MEKACLKLVNIRNHSKHQTSTTTTTTAMLITHNRCMSCTSLRRLHPASQSSSQHCPSRTINRGQSNGRPMPHCKYAPQSVFGNSSYKLYYDTYVITDRTVYNNRPDRVILDKPSKKHARAHTHTYTHIHTHTCHTQRRITVGRTPLDE